MGKSEWSGYVPTEVLKHHGENPAMQKYIKEFKGLEKHVGGLHSICLLFNAISKLEAEKTSWRKEVEDQKTYVTSLEQKILELTERK